MNVAPTEFKLTFFIFVVLFNSENFSRPETFKKYSDFVLGAKNRVGRSFNG